MKLNPLLIATLALMISFGGSSCASKKTTAEAKKQEAPKNPYVPTNAVESKVILEGDTLLMGAGYELLASYTSGDTVHARISHAGGCGFSDFYLRRNLETATKEVYKIYRTSNDWCKDPQQVDIFFVVTPTAGKSIEIYSKAGKRLK